MSIAHTVSEKVSEGLAGPVSALTSAVFRKVHAVHLRQQCAPVESQDRCLESLRPLFSGTAAARTTGIARIPSYKRYVREVPPACWHDYAPYVERVDAGERNVLFNDTPRFMAMTSGTTGYLNKGIPYNDAMLDAFRAYQFLVAASMASACPRVNPVFDYRIGYASAQVRGGVNPQGLPRTYTSTVLTGSAPALAPRRFLPDDDTLAIADWNEKLDALCAQVRGKDVRIVTGIPLYMVNIFEHLVKRLGVACLAEVWPNLAVFFYSGSSIEPFRRRIEELAGARLTFLSGYIATEGPLGFPVDATGLMAFNLDRFLFTFLPLDGQMPQGFDDVVSGDAYEVLVGMPNGFLQYRTGDVVRVERVGSAVYFRFVGRREATINLGNEKVSQPQLEEAFRRATAKLGLVADHFFVHPEHDAREGARYAWTIPCREAALGDDERVRLEVALAATLDEELMHATRNYEDSRVRDALLGPPRVTLCDAEVCQRAFQRGRDRGQFKLKTVLRSADELDALLH